MYLTRIMQEIILTFSLYLQRTHVLIICRKNINGFKRTIQHITFCDDPLTFLRSPIHFI